MLGHLVPQGTGSFDLLLDHRMLVDAHETLYIPQAWSHRVLIVCLGIVLLTAFTGEPANSTGCSSKRWGFSSPNYTSPSSE
jgi:hypothetical protein